MSHQLLRQMTTSGSAVEKHSIFLPSSIPSTFILPPVLSPPLSNMYYVTWATDSWGEEGAGDKKEKDSVPKVKAERQIHADRHRHRPEHTACTGERKKQRCHAQEQLPWVVMRCLKEIKELRRTDWKGERQRFLGLRKTSESDLDKPPWETHWDSLWHNTAPLAWLRWHSLNMCSLRVCVGFNLHGNMRSGKTPNKGIYENLQFNSPFSQSFFLHPFPSFHPAFLTFFHEPNNWCKAPPSY